MIFDQSKLNVPMLYAGLGLLSGGYDRRVNPWQSAMRGFAAGQQQLQNQQYQDMQKRRLGLLEKQDERAAAEALRQQNMLTALGELGPDATPEQYRSILLAGGDYKTALQGVLGQPQAPQTRKFPAPGGMVQEQQFVNGEWQNVGEPYHRRDPFKAFQTFDPTTGAFQSGFVDTRTLGTDDVATTITGTTPAETKPTQAHTESAGFLGRMRASENILSGLEGRGFDPGSMLERGPAAVSNYLASPEYQSYRQAQEDWVRAKLRKESGAVIGREEMDDEISVYFAQPGDTDATRRQKRESRRRAEEAMLIQSGPLGEPRSTPPAPRRADFDDPDAFLEAADKWMSEYGGTDG